MSDHVKNYWALNKESDNSAIFLCIIEDRVKALFIEWFELEIEFMQTEANYIDERAVYKIQLNDPEKIYRINNFCIATNTQKPNLS